MTCLDIHVNGNNVVRRPNGPKQGYSVSETLFIVHNNEVENAGNICGGVVPLRKQRITTMGRARPTVVSVVVIAVVVLALGRTGLPQKEADQPYCG